MTGLNYSVDGFTKADLTGKLIIKAGLGDDIRCIPIHNEDITYDELVLMMQRVFSGRLSSSDDVTIKYRDEDGDLVTIFDSSDLAFAIHCSRVLKITLLVNGQPRPLEADQVKHMRAELADIRNRVNQLLDRLDLCSTSTSASEQDSFANDKVDHGGAPPLHIAAAPATAMAGSGKEFDPLAAQRISGGGSVKDGRAQSSSVDAGGQGYARAGTPDSINSLGSASADPSLRPVTFQPATGQGQGQGYASHSQQPVDQYGQQGQQPRQQDYAEQQQYQQQQQLHQQQQRASAFVQPGMTNAGYPPPPPQQQLQQQPGYAQQQPVQTGFVQQQPVQTGYIQSAPQSQQQARPGYVAQPGYAQPSQQQQPVAAPQGYAAPQPGYVQGFPGQQPQGPATPSQGFQQTPGPAAPSPSQGTNPYSRGATYGQYPRPQGQYPQGPQ